MEINYEHQLAQDFLLFLDLCKDANKAFPANSNDSKLAQQWIDHLCTTETENLHDKRIKNIYMSHLCAFLNEGQLKGPFIKEPPKGKLEKVDFYEMPASPQAGDSSSPTQPPFNNQTLQYYDQYEANDHTDMNATNQPSVYMDPNHPIDATQSMNLTDPDGQMSAFDSTNPTFDSTILPDPCNCPPQPCQCYRNSISCTCNRVKAGADSTPSNHHLEEAAICNFLMNEQKFTPEFLYEFNDNLTSFMDLCQATSAGEGKTAQLQNNSKSQFQVEQYPPRHKFLPKYPTLLDETNVSSCLKVMKTSTDDISSGLPSDYAQMAKDVKELLEAISSELRGDVEAGSNAYLDRELSRYKDFIMNHSNLNPNNETSEGKLRNCLLLSLQNDLVKLLNDNFS